MNLDRIMVLDRMILQNEEHIATMQIHIGNWKKERKELFDGLSDEEKKALDPPAPAAPPESRAESTTDTTGKSKTNKI